MAVYKSVKGVGKTASSLKNILEYVGNQKEGEEDRVYKTTGINTSDDYERAFKSMMMTKRIHNNIEGRQYRHHTQSFAQGEITAEKAHELAIKFVEKNFKNFDVFIATHIDKNHIHNHFIINTIDRETGLKFNELNKREQTEKKEKKLELKSHEFLLEHLKKSSDELCLEYGISVIDRTKSPKSLNIYDKKEYYAIKKKGYKVELALLIKKTAKGEKNKENFIQTLKENGIFTEWSEHKKHITFHFSGLGKKSIRLSNLEKTFQDDFFTKESLEREFLRSKEEKIEIKFSVSTKQREEEKSTLNERYQKILEEQKNKKKEEEKRKKEELEKEKAWKKRNTRNTGWEI